MTNKLISVFLVLIVVIAGGAAYYFYSLNQRIDNLSQALSSYQAEQEAYTDAISENLAELSFETGARLDGLGSQLAGARDDIDSLSGGLSAFETDLNTVSGQVSDLAGRLAATETEILTSMFSPSAAYRKVSPATVRITNGQSVIGSGFVYDSQGHVVTAYHVIEGLSPIVVIAADGHIFEAEVTGYSDISDVAVLKLAGNPSIPPAVMGDSSRVQIGEPVIAIGSPLDIRETLTAGIISQVNRYTNYGADSNWVPNLLQFDAPVNPGNSGGPLANGAGEVIGIVVARISASEGDGIYYAVAGNKAKRVADAVIAGGFFPYPWIGVSIVDLTPDEAQSKGLETTNGVNVSGVDAGGPARAAGILPGDIILALGGTPVRDTAELTSYLGENFSPGETVIIEVLRGNSRLELAVTVGTRGAVAG